MKRESTFEDNGLFYDAKGVQIFGRLRVSGAQTELSMWREEQFAFWPPTSGVMTGSLHDLTKVTLIDCIAYGSGNAGTATGEGYHTAKFFPHYVLAGTQHLDTSSDRIESFTIFLEDAHVLFYDFDAFGSVPFDRSLLREVLKNRRVKRRVRTGKNGMVMYFTGQYEIISFASTLGKVSVGHYPTINFGGVGGVGVKDRVGITVKPAMPVNFSEVPNRIEDLMLLLGVLIGRPQKLVETTLRVRRPRTVARQDTLLRMYWSLIRQPPTDSHREPHPGDVLVSPIHSPKQFKSVCAGWLAKDSEWRDARGQFLDSFREGSSYDRSRIVGAANMFDILPADALPGTVVLSPELAAAKGQARALFKALPASDERQSLLDAVGRLGKASLRQKIRHRASVITAKVATRFPDLDVVLKEAVTCRNHYVHGSPSKIDYSANVGILSFLVDTLEFVFAASDLVEAGWDIGAWVAEPHGGGHPFADYKSDYSRSLAELLKLL